MWIDLALLVAVVLYAIVGLFQGVIVQLFRLGGLVLIVFYARLVAEPLGQWLSGALKVNPLLAYYLLVFVGAFLVYAVCVLIGKGIHRWVSTSGGETPRKANRVLGGVLGLLKGLVVVFVLTALVDMIPVEAMGRWSWAQAQVRESQILPVVHEVNPLPQLRFLADLDDYKKILEDPEAQRILQRQPEFVRLQDHPKFRQAVNDEGLRELIGQKRWPQVLVHEKVLALAFDGEVREILNKLKPKATLEEAERLRSGRK